MRSLSSGEDTRALEWYGNSFIKMPRIVCKLACSKKKGKCLLGRLLLFLICLCFYADGYVMLNKKKLFCRRGEYVCSLRSLAEVTGISYGSVRRQLAVLSDMGLITVTMLDNGCRIRVCGYEGLVTSQDAKKTVDPAKTPEQLHAEQVHALRGDKKSDESTSKTMN